MVRRLLLKLAILTGVSATSLYGYDSGCCYNDCDPLGSGFQIGAYGAAYNLFFHVQDTAGTGTEVNQWTYDSLQRAGAGGGFIGYGFCFCDRFNLSFQVAAAGFSSEARHAWHDDNGNTDEVFKTKPHLRYVIDLNLKPGALIGNCLLMYLKFGASYAGLKHKFLVKNNDPPFDILASETRNVHDWGFVFGFGSNVAISRCVSAFVEYDWRNYNLSDTKIALFNIGGEADRGTSQLTTLRGSGLSAGLMYTF